MIRPQRLVLVLGLMASALTQGGAGVAADAPHPPAAETSPDARAFAGTWLAESARRNRRNNLSLVWRSKMKIAGNAFALSKFYGVSKDLTGTFTLDPSASPKAIDLNVNEFDLAETGSAFKYPACTLPGIYRVEADRLTVCFQTGSGAKRPTDFQPTDKDTVVLTLVRPDADFTDFPKDVTVRVADVEGRPVAGASVFGMMARPVNVKKPEVTPEWKYTETAKTAADGTARVPYGELADCPAAARDAGKRMSGFTAVSPASLQKGTVAVVLAPECLVSGTILCDELAKAGKPIGWTNVWLMYNGQRVGMCSSLSGEFEFRVPPGSYTLDAYGEELPTQKVPITVPVEQSELRVVPIVLTASRLVALKGRPAPELEGVVGWKGQPTTLADLRGKFILLDFWGYWCGPCVADMPVLIDLHERFADKGLAVVGVHLDVDGEVDTAARLDEKLADVRKRLWKGKDLPFPVALVSGGEALTPSDEIYRARAAAQYGVLGYPTTILIDREGKVVGQFYAHDPKEAVAEVEKLVGARKVRR